MNETSYLIQYSYNIFSVNKSFISSGQSQHLPLVWLMFAGGNTFPDGGTHILGNVFRGGHISCDSFIHKLLTRSARVDIVTSRVKWCNHKLWSLLDANYCSVLPKIRAAAKIFLRINSSSGETKYECFQNDILWIIVRSWWTWGFLVVGTSRRVTIALVV